MRNPRVVALVNLFLKKLCIYKINYSSCKKYIYIYIIEKLAIKQKIYYLLIFAFKIKIMHPSELVKTMQIHLTMKIFL